MENSCDNCRSHFAPVNYSGCVLGIGECYECDKWQPDYPTLEQENVDIKLQLECQKQINQALVKIAEKDNREIIVMNRELNKLEPALEWACETLVNFIADYEDCSLCPVYKGKKCKLSETDGCKDALVRYFEELQNAKL